MDIGLFLSPDGTSIDLALENGDIALDSSLQTSVLLSLKCDRLAGPDDTLPFGVTDRRGWWGDAFLQPLPDGSPDFYGSKLWLRRRCTATPANAQLIQDDINEALAWMIATGVASDIAVSTSWASATGLNVSIAISQTRAGVPVVTRFRFLWDASLGTLST